MIGSRPRAVPTVLIDNDRVAVTEWRFAAGAETGWHVHGMVALLQGRDGPMLLTSDRSSAGPMW